jgi:hypothetical protein
MTFKPALWQPIAFVLSALNLAAVGFAAGSAEPEHAAVHAGLALAFGLWTQRLGQRRGASESRPRLEGSEMLEEIEGQMDDFQRQLSETQERLDFVERVLAQGRETRQVGPENPERP